MYEFIEGVGYFWIIILPKKLDFIKKRHIILNI